MRKLILTTTFILSPFAALAESQGERLEQLSKDMTRIMWGMMAAEVEKEGGDGEPLRAAIAKFTWTDALDAATDCALERYIAEIGSAGVDEMLDRMDAMTTQMGSMTLTQWTDNLDPAELLPEGLTEDESLAISQDCGMLDAQSDMMQETGFTAAMMAGMAATQ